MVDDEGAYYQEMFLELASTRQSGMNGLLPISYFEIKAYLELNDIEISPKELQLLKIADRAYLQEVGKIGKEQE